MTRKLRQLAVVCPAICAVVAIGCSAGPEVERIGTRAVLIGIDGADWKLIEEIAADGGMPNLMGLRERGVWGRLETLSDIPLSPVIWTSVATGKTAAKHGISWFMVDRPDGTRVPVRSHNRKVKAIWNILAEADREAGVVGWWASYPAEEIGDGLMVSDGLGFHGFGSTARGGEADQKVYPASRFAGLDALLPPLQQVSYDFVSRFVSTFQHECAVRSGGFDFRFSKVGSTAVVARLTGDADRHEIFDLRLERFRMAQ